MGKKKNNRAEIFLSYDSLKGFKSYIAARNEKIVERKELLPDSLEELDWKIKLIGLGKMVSIVFYENGKYYELEGMVSYLDIEQKKILRIVDKEIKIEDIIKMSGEGMDDYLPA